MSSWMHRTWTCDVSHCSAHTHSSSCADETPSSYSPPPGWLVFRPWLHPVRHSTGRVVLCPEHAPRAHAYLDANVSWKASRALVCQDADWSTPEGRSQIQAKLTTWFAANPHPVVDLGLKSAEAA